MAILYNREYSAKGIVWIVVEGVSEIVLSNQGQDSITVCVSSDNPEEDQAQAYVSDGTLTVYAKHSGSAKVEIVIPPGFKRDDTEDTFTLVKRSL